MPGISIQTAPPELAGFLGRMTAELRASFPKELVGIVLHGSLAMGSFHPPKSDLDLLIVVTDLDEAGRRSMYDALAALNAERPYAAGLEVSVLRTADALQPRHPIPFLVHLGDNTTGPQPLRAGALPRDPDLAGHFQVARTRGVSLYGPTPDEVLGPVAWEDYLASITADLDEVLAGEAILGAPRYAVLNLCRWAMMQKTGTRTPPSKEEGGEWALANAPGHLRPIIAQALAAYRSDADGDLRTAGGPWDRSALLAFRDWGRGLR